MTKTAVITGITSGIGQAIAESLKQTGWKVLGVSRHLPAEQEGYDADLSLLDGLEPLAARISQDAGEIDAFIHVAGVWHDGKQVLIGKKLHEFTTEQIVSTMNVGLHSAMILSARLMPSMRQGGCMMYVSGLFQDGGANWLPYYVSKRALEDFIIGLAEDEQSVHVVGISPADTATDSLKRFYPENIANAQKPEQVAKICVDIINNVLPVTSGTIVEVKDGKAGAGYHR